MGQTSIGARKILAKRFGITLEELIALMESGQKRCIKCKSWRPIELFGKDRTRNDGLGSTCSECRRVKVRVSIKGRVSAFRGRTHTAEAKAKMSAARINNQNKKGKPLTQEQKTLISRRTREAMPKGDECWWTWKGGVTPANQAARGSSEYDDWRKAVYERDGFTCQQCGDDRGGNLQAHHIKSFADHPELRFEVSNGVTLCQECHERMHLKAEPTTNELRRRRKHVS